MFKEFKAFIMRGNVLDLAIAVIIGAAFGRIVTSLVNDIIMPPIGLVTNHVNFNDLFIDLWVKITRPWPRPRPPEPRPSITGSS